MIFTTSQWFEDWAVRSDRNLRVAFFLVLLETVCWVVLVGSLVYGVFFK